MSNENPATPPSGATPGSDEKVITTPSTTTTPPGESQPEVKVTITAKEYRDLQRAKARTLSFDKRVALGNKGVAGQGTNPPEGADPELVEKFNKSETLRVEAERRALQSEIRGQVRDLLEKDEFKTLPRSTRELILKNPAMLSNAETLEEAMLDIEDFVRDQVIVLEKVAITEKKPEIQTPPATGSGAPTPPGGTVIEDTSKLFGPQRSQATLRNLMRTKGKN